MTNRNPKIKKSLIEVMVHIADTAINNTNMHTHVHTYIDIQHTHTTHTHTTHMHTQIDTYTHTPDMPPRFSPSWGGGTVSMKGPCITE